MENETQVTPEVIETVESNEPDYKALFEEAQKEHQLLLAKKDKEIEEQRYKLNKKRIQEKLEDDDDEEDDDKSIILKKLEELEKKIDRPSSPDVSSIISSLTSNPDEQALIKFHYDNRIVKSGSDTESIRKDLVAARAIANSSRIEKQLSEAKLALKTQSEVSTMPAGLGGVDKHEVSTSPLSKDQLEYLKKRKFTPEMIKEFEQKILAQGK